VSRDFPLEFHETARRAAVAGRSTAEQGKYWEMRQTIFANSGQLQADEMLDDAGKSSLDVTKFKACVDSNKYKAVIDKDIAEGTAAGVTGTPSFVLGHVQNGNLNGVRIVGAMPYQQFDAKIQELLKQVPTTKK
jgi:protein-disulfide isomerase